MLVHNYVMADVQSQASAFSWGLRSKEWIADFWLDIFWYTRTGVLDFNPAAGLERTG